MMTAKAGIYRKTNHLTEADSTEYERLMRLDNLVSFYSKYALTTPGLYYFSCLLFSDVRLFEITTEFYISRPYYYLTLQFLSNAHIWIL